MRESQLALATLLLSTLLLASSSPTVDDVVPEVTELVANEFPDCPDVVTLWKFSKDRYAKINNEKKPKAWYQFGSSGIDSALANFAKGCLKQDQLAMGKASSEFEVKRSKYLDTSGRFQGPLGRDLEHAEEGAKKTALLELRDQLYVIQALMEETLWHASGHEITVGRYLKRRSSLSADFPKLMTSELATFAPTVDELIPPVYVGVFLGVPFFKPIDPVLLRSVEFMPETWYPFKEITHLGAFMTFRDQHQEASIRFEGLNEDKPWDEVQDIVFNHFNSMVGDAFRSSKLTSYHEPLKQLLKDEWEAKTLLKHWNLFPTDQEVSIIAAGLGGTLWDTPIGQFLKKTFDACPPQKILPPLFYDVDLLRALTPLTANNWILRHHATTGSEYQGDGEVDRAAGGVTPPHHGQVACAPAIKITSAKPQKRGKVAKDKEPKLYKYQHFGGY